jgi:hypothetical protein
VSQGQPRKRNNRRRGGSKPKRPDLWRPVPQLGDPPPIRIVDDPTALIRSLGDPPLQGQGAAGGHYLAEVIKKAATLASGIAEQTGLVARDEPEPADAG